MSEAPSSNPKFLLHLHTQSERASQQFTCVTKNINKIHSRRSPFECKAWSWHHHHHYYPLKNHREKKKYTENRLNNSSDQLYMQRTNNLTNKHKCCWKRKMGARVQKKILGLHARGPRLRNVFTILLTCRCGGSRTWDSICMFRYRRPTWWLMSFENWTKKEARHWLVKTLVERAGWEREKKKKEKRSGRKRRDRGLDRGRESERAQENRRARFLAIAFWLRSDDGVYTAQGPSHPPHHPPTLVLGFWKITT